jgi:hypothetical protein
VRQGKTGRNRLHRHLDDDLFTTSSITAMDIQAGWELHDLSHVEIKDKDQVCKAKL